MKKKWNIIIFVAVFFMPLLMFAHDGHKAPSASTEQPRKFQPIIIYPDKSIDSHRHDTTDRVQVLRKDQIEKSTANSLSELVDNLPGVDTQDYCVNCGAKRLTINGLRAEHTSLLVDGIPLYSSISSVYGLDTIPSLAIEEIEVMRGSGSALINPDSIGGTINVFTIHPQTTSSKLRAFLGTQQTQNFEFLQNIVGEKTRWSFGGEFNKLNVWDVDKNGVVEAPFRERTSFFLKQTTFLSEQTQWSLRYGQAQLEIIGGNSQQWKPSGISATQADDFDFVDGDVRKPFIGELSEITDYLKIRRQEITSKLVHIYDSENTLEFNLGSSLYQQDSIYMHGFDYNNKDLVIYADLRWNHQLTTAQSLLMGISGRRETLRSESVKMYQQDGTPRDDFNYLSTAAFVQHEWQLSGGWEISSALRFDHLRNRWLELRNLEETIVVPRFLVKWQPTEHFTNYFAYGRGYRLPLSFVESAHGTYSDGFVVNVTGIEKADSWMLSTSYNEESFYLTPSMQVTRLQNMAYDEKPAVAHSGPIQFVTAQNDYSIVNYELLAGFKPTPQGLIELGYEIFDYEKEYKSLLPTAAIEKRFTVKSQWDWKKYSWNVSGIWIGSRDLSQYSTYADHYNINQGLLGVDAQKRQNSPSYFVWNTSFSYQIKKGSVTLGIDNIGNFTQTRAGDSPAMWHFHDGHAHFDNRHVWGPNRGREAYVRLTLEF